MGRHIYFLDGGTTVDLNDRTNTFWDKLETPGTRFLQVEQTDLQEGAVHVVRVDRSGLVMTAYMIFVETNASLWEDWVRYLEDHTATGVPFHLGDGRYYPKCWASEIHGTPQRPGVREGNGTVAVPPLRRMSVTFKVTSSTPFRSNE